MCCQMTLTPNALSLSVRKTVTVTLTGSAVGTTVEAWCAHLQVSTILLGHFRVAFCLGVKTSLHTKPFIWKCVPPTGSFSCKSHSFSYKRFVLKQRHKVTRKWPIYEERYRARLTPSVNESFPLRSEMLSLKLLKSSVTVFWIILATYKITFKW